ncbi:MAG TPA: heparinase II/III family protein [Symbiobacteriaceae bacterium]|nr:heparinase II/III family protein [Symbiobacteriaceae bacterium]
MIRPLFRKAAVYYHTVKYLSPLQVGHRLKLLALRQVDKRWGKQVLSYHRRRLGPVAAAQPLLDATSGNKSDVLLGASDLRRRMAAADALLRDRFTFLNETISATGIELWRCPEASQLWRYQVHYFDYTVDLAAAYLATGRVVYYQKFKELCESWMEHNWPGVPDSWHPYPLSLRVVNWLYACSWFAAVLDLDRPFRSRLEASVQVQLSYLEKHLEHDVRGNHLLKNAKALVLGALHFPTSPRAKDWLDNGLEVLVQEASEQVLPDGGHFERSWLYHLIVLQDYSEVAWILRVAEKVVPAPIETAVKRMADYVETTTHPDSDIPLFGDSELVGAERVTSILGIARAAVSGEYSMASPGLLNVLLVGAPTADTKMTVSREGAYAFPSTGYFCFRQAGDYMVIDCGAPCPSYLPAHAHCDMLSYELSVSGHRFIVDAGTYEYGAGPNRQAFRSTLAHNTLVVNGQEQSEAWGAFRLARRAAVIGGRQAANGEVEAFVGCYHTPVGGFLHQRSVLWVRRKSWVIVDQVWGNGPLAAQNQLLLAPDWGVEVTEQAVKASLADTHMSIRPLDSATVVAEHGWYAPTFGERHGTTRVLLETRRHLNQFVTAYIIAPTGEDTGARLEGEVVWLGSELSWSIPSKPI